MNNKNIRDARIGWLFAAPWVFGFCIFMVYPLIMSLYYSLTDYAVLRPPSYIGLANYQELASDKVFKQALGNTFLYAIAAVPLGTVTAIGLALLLNTKVKGMAFYRTMFYVPSLVPQIALGVLWFWIFNGEYGLLNSALKPALGPLNQLLAAMHRGPIAPPNWLGEPLWAKSTLIIIAMWGAGNAMVIYLAGLQDIPISLYEAAEIDGAKTWQKTKKVTIPMLSPVIMFNVIMGIIGSMQVFAVPYLMFPGGAPERANNYVSMYLYDNAFRFSRMGYASAMGWVMFAIVLTLTLIALKISNKYVHYEAN